MRAWHFLKDDCRLRYRDGEEVDDGEIVEIGKTYTAVGDIDLCKNGMHGSKRILDALQYAPGSIVCKVEIDGEIVEGDDKLVGRSRTVLSMVDITDVLHEFACLCAEKALTAAKVTDKRSWGAIAAKRAWLRGEIDSKQLAAAYADAVAAAGAYAYAAAGAYAAAVAAAAAAATDADAAADAAAAAYAAAAYAYAYAVKDEQNTLLTKMVHDMRKTKK